MTVLLHISDPHFGTEQARVVEAVVALARQLQPELVVLSGDITQRARPAQFRAARAFIDRMGAPWLVIPGNHDIALFDLLSRLWRPYARYRTAFGEVLEPCHESNDLLVLGVKTTRRRRHVHGEVSAEQVERVAGRLRTARDEQLRVVVVHHPLVVPPGPDESNLLRGHAHARQTWAAAGADLVLGGHIHVPFVMPVPGAARAAWVVQAGTAVSSRVRSGMPNSVNVVRWERGQGDRQGNGPGGVGRAAARITVEQWDHSAASGAFEPRAVKRLVPGADLKPAV
jgi:3',5'-cyclic AMP phosphodiesterase CpdA